MPRPFLVLALSALFSLHGSAAVAANGCATVGWSRPGLLTNEQFGSAVACVDVNHDGHADLLVGAPGQDLVYLYLGTGVPASPFSSTPGWTFHGAPGSVTGFCVVGVGDVNNDGYADFAVGAPLYVSGGAVYVFLGGPSGPSTTPWATLQGSDAGGHFGAALCGGDLNGDGFSDLVVGAPTWHVGGLSVGAAFVYRGSVAQMVIPSAGWSRVGQTAGDQFGAAIATSDLDGDGHLDLAVGAPGAGSGSVQVFRASSPGLSPTPDATIAGDQPDSQFGAALLGGSTSMTIPTTIRICSWESRTTQTGPAP